MTIDAPKRFILTGTGPRAGRTTVGCALAFAFKVRGMRVGVMTPVALGCQERDGVLAADEASAMIAAASSGLALDLAGPCRYRSRRAPLDAAREDGLPPPDPRLIDAALSRIDQMSDVLLVEDCIGLDTRLDAARDFADLAAAFRLEPLLIVSHREGFAAAARRSVDFARARGLQVRGMILNAVDAVSAAAIDDGARRLAREVDAPMLGVLRFKEPLGLAIVEQLL